MKIKLQLKRTPDSAPEYYYTNLFVSTEWERITGRNVQQMVNAPQISDYCVWMFTILKMKGEQIGDNWRDWVKSMPEMHIEPVLDETNPNPTDAAPTAAN